MFRFVDIKKRVFDEHHGLVSLVLLVYNASMKWDSWVLGGDLCICGRTWCSSGMKYTFGSRWTSVITIDMPEEIPSRDFKIGCRIDFR